ncbi:hypothetical protein TP70_03160 [Staphylococcus microti]|uniref:Uncharacterized protein n=1 Tax=Staphylococcus microti TaxID=569857 RepID=A0A0D6XTX4_9STAP|nr:hypothetical protein [Staphylococcus microti]KIX91308.1 hypothetical protein TP70_03160 [Staphylococcus microti]PNZ82767.1 hypothetical protein CD132_03425 [Staphylococcus microti]SUM56642.1 Uncharacterised protein [Staphylococcus microti]
MESKLDLIMGSMSVAMAIFVYILTPEHIGLPIVMFVSGMSLILIGIKNKSKTKTSKCDDKSEEK